jgi:pimeloyl-ACP methyl ester carboxylesterase
VVLLHGLLDSSAGWADLASASRRRCLAIDLPGFGRSTPPCRPRLGAYAEDVVWVLRHLAVRSCTLVGHSLGGGVATAVAEHMRGEVGSLVLSAPVGFGRVPLAELAALPVARELVGGLLPYILSRPILLDPLYASLVASGSPPTDDLRQRLAADARRLGPGVRAAVEAMAAAGRSPRAFYRRRVRYDGPVSVVWGDRDALVPPSHADGVRAALPQARVHLSAGMGHHPQRERPKDLAELVEAACGLHALGLANHKPSRRGSSRRLGTHAVDLVRSPISATIALSYVTGYTITHMTRTQLMSLLSTTVDKDELRQSIGEVHDDDGATDEPHVDAVLDVGLSKMP